MGKASQRFNRKQRFPSVNAVQTCVAYDERLFERVRTQWRQGDWEGLVCLDLGALEPHPERAKLSLLVASAWLQQGDATAARHYLRRAMAWGCGKKIAAQILMAGVHHNLGRAAAVLGDEKRMNRHFSATVAGSGPAELSCRAFTPALRDEQPLTVVYPPHGITSYAQNFEDVMLWRALWNVKNGFYIDIGAWDPVVDSVSKAFYEQGWRGVHVEPLAEYAEKIRQDRHEDKVIQALIGKETGKMLFHAIPLTGLSTTADRFASNAEQAGWPMEDRIVPCVTLAQVFTEIGSPDIHWLKIDVEGMESDVLAGWSTHQARPWVVVIEATEPLSSKPTWEEWESQLFIRNYRFVYFDGLNRFYLHEDHLSITNRFSVPPNVFDCYKKHIPESRPENCIPK